LCENAPLDADLAGRLRRRLGAAEGRRPHPTIAPAIVYSAVSGSTAGDAGGDTRAGDAGGAREYRVEWHDPPIFVDAAGFVAAGAAGRAVAAGVFVPTDDFAVEHAAKVCLQLCAYDGACFLGASLGHGTLAEALQDPKVQAPLDRLLDAVAGGLAVRHPGRRDGIQQRRHRVVTFLADCRATDAIGRNCRDPLRKLAAGERFVAPAKLVLAEAGAAGIAPAVDVLVAVVRYAEALYRRDRGLPYDPAFAAALATHEPPAAGCAGDGAPCARTLALLAASDPFLASAVAARLGSPPP
jgi:hypothetical protein